MFKQIIAVTAVNLKSIPQRWAPSLVVMIGLAGVVAVFTALLAMAEGFSQTLSATGSNDRAIIMRGGSDAELNSGFGRDEATLIRQLPGIAKDSDGKPLVSAEMIMITELSRRGENSPSNVTLRGVEAKGLTLRPNLKIVEGKAYTPGLREVVVGRGVNKEFSDTDIGSVMRFRGSDWTVVGIFESQDAYESEIFADTETAQSTFNRTGYSSVLVELETTDSLQQLIDQATSDKRLNVDIKRQQEYFSGQTKQFRQTIGVLAGVVTFMMALGAIFAALNTMYSTVSARSKEIGTLRALGFGGFPVVVSVLVESMALSLVGGVVGAALAFVLFNNVSLSTLGQSFSQVVFSFKVTPELAMTGLGIALVVGFIGGLLPAIRAARIPITTALRG